MKKIAYAIASATFKLFFGSSFEEMEALQVNHAKCVHELKCIQALLTQELLDAGFIQERNFTSDEIKFSVSEKAHEFWQRRSRYFQEFIQKSDACRTKYLCAREEI